MKKILLLAGDYSEDYETMVPFQAMELVGYQVDVVCPDKKAGEKIITAVHDFGEEQTYSEKPGHYFTLNKSFDDIVIYEYDGLFISGGRSSEYLSIDERVVSIVKCFVKSGKPVASICHGAQILAATDCLTGRTLTCYPAVSPMVKLAGGNYVEVPADQAVVDGNLVTAPAWPGNVAILREFIRLLEA